MSNRPFLSASTPRFFALHALLFLFLLMPKCDHSQPGPTTTSAPNIGTDAAQAFGMVVSQADETEDFVARFKGKAGSFTPQQVEFAKAKYEQTMSQINPVVDLIKQNASGAASISEEEFRSKAKSAIDTNVVLNTLMEKAVGNTNDFNNFVLTNANALPDAWTKVWTTVPTLTEPQRQEFFAFLDVRIHYRAWDTIKKH